MLKVGCQYMSDKITFHGYYRFYDYFLVPLINKKINVLEIGVDDGSSIKMWNDFFVNGKIYGLDINKEYTHEKGKVIKGDQSDINVLIKLTKEIGKCMVIIDDGSHVPEHQLLGFNYLFEHCLDLGGIYIIEDIETSYWRKGELYGYTVKSGIKKKNNIVRIFKKIVDIVNREFLLDEHIETIKKSQINFNNLKYISMITFAYNCIIIRKMTHNEYEKFGNRKYRLLEYL